MKGKGKKSSDNKTSDGYDSDSNSTVSGEEVANTTTTSNSIELIASE